MCACRIISSSRLRHKTALDWRNMLGNSAPQTSSHIHVSDRIGGAGRDRTDGLIVANDALSQLSYSPTSGKVLLSHFISHLLCRPNEALVWPDDAADIPRRRRSLCRSVA